MTNKEAIKELKGLQEFINGTRLKGEIKAEAFDLAIKALESSSWIPVETRDLTADEVAELMKSTDIIDSDDIDHWCYCCPLPDHNQDVMITTEYGDIRITPFYADEYGCYFEDYEDRDDVLAWMPLPKPYTKEETT